MGAGPGVWGHAAREAMAEAMVEAMAVAMAIAVVMGCSSGSDNNSDNRDQQQHDGMGRKEQPATGAMSSQRASAARLG